MDWIEELRVLPGILYAMALGGAIGFERELKDRPAGFRTHMLVAGTAALLLGLSRMILEDAHYAGTGLQIDPLRLVEAVVAGISFIGAGTPPIIPSWGNIMAEGRALWQVKPYIVFFPAIFLSLTVLAVNLLGDGLRDWLDPRMAKKV